MMYAALEWCTQNYTQFIDELRELCGGGVFQMPANISVMKDPSLRASSRLIGRRRRCDAITRMKLFKLAWDMVGSEFAGRHQQYEKFYAGASFIVRNHSFRETDWAAFNKIVENLMASYDHPAPRGPAKRRPSNRRNGRKAMSELVLYDAAGVPSPRRVQMCLFEKGCRLRSSGSISG